MLIVYQASILSIIALYNQCIYGVIEMVDILRSSEFSLAVGIIGALGNGIYTYTMSKKLEESISQTIEDTNTIKAELKSILATVSKNQVIPQAPNDTGLSEEVNKLGNMVDDLTMNQIAVANVLGYKIAKKNKRSRKSRRDKSPVKKSRRSRRDSTPPPVKKPRRRDKSPVYDSESDDDYSDESNSDDYSSDDSIDDYI